MTPQDLPNQDHPMQDRVQQAIAYFRQGYNCSQSVAMAFADHYHIDPQTMARLAASFGGGIGRMRETCGAASGMFLLAGLETTDGSPDPEKKKHNYQVVQQLAARFKHECGTLLCKELLGLVPPQGAPCPLPQDMTDPKPAARTDEYYRKRPCIKTVELAARIYAQYLTEQSADTKACSENTQQPLPLAKQIRLTK